MARAPRGVHKYQPAKEDRDRVKVAVGLGLTHEQIARLIFKKNGQPITERTLRNHFAKELVEGKSELHFRVAGAIVQRGLAGSDVLLMFFAKTQMGWREKDRAPTAPDNQDARQTAADIRATLAAIDETVP